MTETAEIISIKKEDREKAMVSDSEGLVLMMLYYMENGMHSPELKKALKHLNNNDLDAAEESLDSLRSEGLVSYTEGNWIITDAGKEFLRSFATFENPQPKQESN